MLRRLPDWPERLAQLVQQRQALPFAWGTNDCAAWAADAVLAITGSDPLGSLRGTWSTQLGAQRRLQALGGLHAATTAALGQPLASPLLAQRGDVLLVNGPQGQALAVCLGDRLAGPAEGGLVFGRMFGVDPAADGAPLVAWGVGHA